MEKGFVDLIVPRREQRRVIADLIDLHRPRRPDAPETERVETVTSGG